MKNVIIGTSGHVDHGKTCLIKAITGTDCDRLKEEKKRGITIENGFADFSYKDYNISIIDVPGHEKFVRNMLMGIGGIDLVLLVISLDEGVMPQTIEHFRILSMLNIKKGIIVYTKRDMVNDDDWISMVKDDAKNLVKGTFMENAPSIEVSSFTGLNIDKLKELIVENIDEDNLKKDYDNLFRLPIDRVFTISGFGTVITGTLIEGKVSVGDEIMLYPKGILTKVRNIEVHNEKVESSYAGLRTAVNLQGLKKEDIERGAVLSKPNSLIPTNRLDVKLSLFKDSEKEIHNDSKVHLYVGAAESVCRVVLLDRDVLKKGETCYATLKLESEIVCKRNDNFIIRFLSPLISIGGGKVLEENPIKHKRKSEEDLNNLLIKDEGNIKDIIALIVKERRITLKDLANKLNMKEDELKDVLKESKDIILLKNGLLIEKSFMENAKMVVQTILDSYHKENEMSYGLSKEEFRSKVGKQLKIEEKKIIDLLIELLVDEKFIITEGNTVRLSSFKKKVSNEMSDRFLKKYLEGGFSMPTIDDVISLEKDKKNARHALEDLVREGKLVKLNDTFLIHEEYFKKALNVVKDETNKNGEITLATFRDLVGTSRKYAIPILEYLDEKKITKMIGEARIWISNN